MATRTTTANRDVTAELAYLTRALKAPNSREAIDRLAERAPNPDMKLRGVPRRAPASRGSRPRVPWRRGKDPRCPVPVAEVVGGVRLRHARDLKRDTIAHLGRLDSVTAPR